MSWGPEASDLLLKESWTCFATPDSESPNLLIKVHLQDSSSKGLALSLLASDTRSCLYEHLNQRQLTRRFTDAFNDSQDSQSQAGGPFTGYGADGEQELRRGVHELVQAIRDGSAKVTLTRAAFENIITIQLPGSFGFRFVCDSLDNAAAEALSTHLLTPLLGLSSALLSLVTPAAIDDGSLALAVDTSAKSERLKEGRACQVFFTEGGSALGRWVQRFNGTKESLINRVRWEDSQDAVVASGPRPSAESSTKGKEREKEPSKEEPEEEEEEPPTEDEDEGGPVPQARPSVPTEMDVDSPDEGVGFSRGGGGSGEGEGGAGGDDDEEPPTDDEDDGPSPTGNESESLDEPIATPVITKSVVESEKDKKRKKAEEELEREQAARRAVIAKQKALVAAKAKGGVVKKKKKL
ncbi:hypothetical protein RQP46_004558 [Phenoliferia psychrophenolica]